MYPRPIRNLAQVLLLVIAIPIILLVISFISPQEATGFVKKMFEGLPIFDTWLGLLHNYKTFALGNILDIYLNSFFEAFILGICMTACGKIAKFLKATLIMPSCKIVVAFAGFAVGVFLANGLAGMSGFVLILFGCIIVYGLIFMFRAVLPIPDILSWRDVLIALYNGMVAVILTGFIAGLYLFMGKAIGFGTLLGLMVLSMVAMVVLYFVDGRDTI